MVELEYLNGENKIQRIKECSDHKKESHPELYDQISWCIFNFGVSVLVWILIFGNYRVKREICEISQNTIVSSNFLCVLHCLFTFKIQHSTFCFSNLLKYNILPFKFIKKPINNLLSIKTMLKQKEKQLKYEEKYLLPKFEVIIFL